MPSIRWMPNEVSQGTFPPSDKAQINSNLCDFEAHSRDHGLFKPGVSLEIRASIDDIARYIEGHISDLPSIVQQSQQLRVEITTEISKAVDGMYVLSS